MKVLLVMSGNILGVDSDTLEDYRLSHPFVVEQASHLSRLGVSFCLYPIKGKGILGYLKNIRPLRHAIRRENPDIIHSHYGLSGFISVFYLRCPKVVTFHGTDLNLDKERMISSVVSLFSDYRIFVSEKLVHRLIFRATKNFQVIPCGVNLNEFYPVEQKKAKELLGLDRTKRYILFASGFANWIKNATLAFEAVHRLKEVELLELSNRKRDEVNLLLNAVDVLLMTSFAEGSPVIIKEAMAANCPIVSTDVGDVKALVSGVDGCYISSYDPVDVAAKISLALAFNGRTRGREKVLHLDNALIAEKIYKIYQSLVA